MVEETSLRPCPSCGAAVAADATACAACGAVRSAPGAVPPGRPARGRGALVAAVVGGLLVVAVVVALLWPEPRQPVTLAPEPEPSAGDLVSTRLSVRASLGLWRAASEAEQHRLTRDIIEAGTEGLSEAEIERRAEGLRVCIDETAAGGQFDQAQIFVAAATCAAKASLEEQLKDRPGT